MAGQSSSTESQVQLRQLRPSFSSHFKEFFVRHLQVFFYSLGTAQPYTFLNPAHGCRSGYCTGFACRSVCYTGSR